MRVQDLLMNKVVLFNETTTTTSDVHTEYVIFEKRRVIPPNAFLNYRELKKVVFPEDIQDIGHDAFNGCQNLEFRLPRNIMFLGTRAFASVKGTKKLVIPGGIKTIQIDCFMYTTFEDVVIEEGVTQLGDVFRGAKIGTLYLPRSMQTISINNLNACRKIVCFEGTHMEEFCKEHFTGMLQIKGR